MSMKHFNTIAKRWEYVESYGWEDQGKAWTDVIRGSQDNAVLTNTFDHEAGTYLGKGTVLQRDITNMPVHPDSAAMSQWMLDWSPFGPSGGFDTSGQSHTSLNTSAWGTQPIHSYVVDSTHPDCQFRTFTTAATAIQTPRVEIDQYLRGPIPLPSWALPAQNGDHGMAVYDVGTGIMREYFMVNQDADGKGLGNWAGGGGYSLNTPGLMNLAKDNYGLQQRRGLSNVAGMHNSLGFIGIQEVLAGSIQHAMCFTIGASWSLTKTKDEVMAEYNAAKAAGVALPANWPEGPRRVSWPARGADGKAERYIPESTWGLVAGQSKNYTGDHRTPTHGQWGRLKASVDPVFNAKTGKPWSYLMRLMIEAAKKYGVVATDTNLFINAFNAEHGRTWKHYYGMDPWSPYNGGEGYLQQFMARKDAKWAQGTDGVGAFPWDQVEWAPIDWGRPSPDTNLRPGERIPWYRADDPTDPLKQPYPNG